MFVCLFVFFFFTVQICWSRRGGLLVVTTKFNTEHALSNLADQLPLSTKAVAFLPAPHVTSLLSASSQCWYRPSLEVSALGLLTGQLVMDRKRTVGSKSVVTFSTQRSPFCGRTPVGQTQWVSRNKRTVGGDHVTHFSGNMLGKLRYLLTYSVVQSPS